MIEDLETLDKIRTVVGLGVEARRAFGRDDATIRREVVAVAKKALRKHVTDEMEFETAVATAQREVDRLLAGNRLDPAG